MYETSDFFLLKKKYLAVSKTTQKIEKPKFNGTNWINSEYKNGIKFNIMVAIRN